MLHILAPSLMVLLTGLMLPDRSQTQSTAGCLGEGLVQCFRELFLTIMQPSAAADHVQNKTLVPHNI